MGSLIEKGVTPQEKDKNGPENVFPWGSYFPPSLKDGNLGGELDDGDGFIDTPAPVMSSRANELGIYDLGGNVMEWTQDWYDKLKATRVLRDSCWVVSVSRDRPWFRWLLSCHRDEGGRGFQHPTTGFRCVLMEAGG